MGENGDKKDVVSSLNRIREDWLEKEIEVEHLREELQRTRQELATALYRVDAAHRTIAKYRKEGVAGARAEAKAGEEIEVTNADGDIADGGKEDKDEEEVKEKDVDVVVGESFGEDLLDKVHKVAVELSTARRKAGKGDREWVGAEQVGAMSEGGKVVVDKEGSCVGQLMMGKDGKGFVGLGNGWVKQVDFEKMEMGHGGCKAHETSGGKGGVSGLWWDKGAENRVVSAGGDGMVRVWDCDAEEWVLEKEMQEGCRVVGVQGHPEGSVWLVGREDGWRWRDAHSGKVITEGRGDEQARYECCAIHPDGLLFAMGRADGVVEMWDVAAMKRVREIGEVGGKVDVIDMSEKGYYMASCHGGDRGVQLWDLRKEGVVWAVDAAHSGTRALGVKLDGAGEFGCAVADGATCVFAARKKAKVLARIPTGEAGGVVGPIGVGWGAGGRFAVVGSGDGVVFKMQP